MDVRISDSLLASLDGLSGYDQKLAKTTVFDFVANPSSPGHQFHKLGRAKDPRFWSVRVGRDIRLIVHRADESLLLCYVGHHDGAYRWAERRKLETHPTTGAAQIVEIRETVVEVPKYVEVEQPAAAPARKPTPLAGESEQRLLEFGVPAEWLADVKSADEDELLEIAGHLPAEAAEAVLELATGGSPSPRPIPAAAASAFEHPDAQRRFRVVTNVEELEAALDAPWEKWAIFLHPDQRELVERTFNGPARVAGSAGTGKTVVALHRAVHLATSNPDSKTLLTTFSPTLAAQLKVKVRRLLASEPRVGERLDVADFNEVGLRLYRSAHGDATVADIAAIRRLIAKTAEHADAKFTARFLLAEWAEVVDPWQLKTWEEYRDVRRLGRKTRLPEARRAALWEIFSQVIDRLESEGLITLAQAFTSLAEDMPSRRNRPYDFVVVDEAQDVSVPQLKFLAALAGDRPNGLFFAGDLGQRIFQTPFSWLSLGVDVRGRSRTLKVNYRTSHQIRTQADRLLGPTVADIDGNVEDRRGTVSVFNGPAPTVQIGKNEEDEQTLVVAWLRALPPTNPQEVAVIVRSDAQLPRAQAAATRAGLSFHLLTERGDAKPGAISICTMHLAKGLEFRAVAVMACDDEILPLQARIESVTEASDLEEVYNTERHLLYVACTRAREHLLLTSSGMPSEFLDDFRQPR